MGTWGTGILSDDTARDLYDEFVELYDAGIELSEIRRRIEEEYRASLEAMDEGPLVWLALAKGQWECDALDADVLARIERIVTTGEGLERWREAGSNQRGTSSNDRPSTSDRKSTRLNSSHSQISYAVFCLKKKTIQSINR